MNFDFTIRVYKSVDPAKSDQIEMVAVEVKKDPCENCVVSVKASAAAFFVEDPSDWSVLKTDLKYDSNSEAYIKFKIKNPGNWVGKGLELLKFSYLKRNKAHPLYCKGGCDDEVRMHIEVVTPWDAETGEVRVKIPILSFGHGVKVCFQGDF